MSNIANAFKNGKAFIPFITCGDPDLETTAKTVRLMAAAGADLIELGIPFSDPTAEGPVIQEANIRALSAGTTTDKVFDLVRDLRRDVKIPMVFMTYANVVFSYGTAPKPGEPRVAAHPSEGGAEKFISTCREIGIDGIILPDVPFEERGDFAPLCEKYGLDLISLVAPTSKERIAVIAKGSTGFLYVVSSLGVTGVRSKITTDIGAMIELIRENSDIPCAVGFGISTPEQARAMSRLADGAIVGSAIVKLVAQYGRGAAEPVAEYVKSMKDAMR